MIRRTGRFIMMKDVTNLPGYELDRDKVVSKSNRITDLLDEAFGVADYLIISMVNLPSVLAAKLLSQGISIVFYAWPPKNLTHYFSLYVRIL